MESVATATRAARSGGGRRATVDGADVRVFEVPLSQPESDGTLTWEATTCVVVTAYAGDERGLGYTYGDAAVATLIESKLIDLVRGADAMRPAAASAAMQHELRNAGRPGIGAMAISAVDIALWDLKARLLDLPLAELLPRFHERVPIYGSGGFTNLDDEQLGEQLRGWVEAGIPRVKIKVGRDPDADPRRLALARRAIGPQTELFVDANGAFNPKQALLWAERYTEWGVSYFEEPVSSEDREGLRLLRDRGPAGVAIAAGEYEWDVPQLYDLADCVDILQADVTRVGGITNMLRADGICKGRNMALSAHCAPALSAHVCAALETIAHIEYFHDHVRVEDELFEGTLEPDGGYLRPDPRRARPWADAARARPRVRGGLRWRRASRRPVAPEPHPFIERWKREHPDWQPGGGHGTLAPDGVGSIDREALAAELGEAVRGEVRFDPADVAIYSHDSSNYRQPPLGVVVPLDADDVVAAIEVCRRHEAPVLPRGCATSLSGETTNVAVVIDTSKHMREILEIDPGRRIARVQPGVIRDQLARA